MTDPDPVTIAPMTAADGEEVLAIYQAGLDTGNASFEATSPDWTAWDAHHLPDHRPVAIDPTGGGCVNPNWPRGDRATAACLVGPRARR